MQVTIKTPTDKLTVECETYAITPVYINIWVKDFVEVSDILEHSVCANIRVSVLNSNYNTWQLGFRSGDIKLEA